MLWLALRFESLPEDPATRELWLKRLAARIYDHTPYIRRYRSDSLLLEISRCLRRAGGVKKFHAALCAALDTLMPDYQLGLAHSGKGAWLLSFQDHPVGDQDDRDTFMQRLARVPLALLEEQPRAVSALQQMGLNYLGEVFALPEAELGRRFGRDFVRELEEIRGSYQLPAPIHQPEIRFHRHIDFDWPVRNTDQLIRPAGQLLQQLMTYLVQHQVTGRMISWRLCSARGDCLEMEIGCELVQGRRDLLLELSRLHFSQISLDFEVERLELSCERTAALELQSGGLFQPSRQDQVQEQAQALVARLQARLGSRAICQIRLQDAHLPESSQQVVAPFSQQSALMTQGQRPCWMLARPKRLQIRDQQPWWHGRLQLLQGPERITGEWWSQSANRDYFVARRPDALHCWIYRDLVQQQWYAHGIFA